jgi:peptidyl-prolyl cis-trans isomerase SurA
MRRALQLGLVLAAVALNAMAAEVVDRIVAVVNREPVLQSDVEDTARFEALLDGRAPAPFTAEQRKAVLQRVIDQRLVEQQLRNSAFPRATPEEVVARIAAIRQQLPAGKSDAEWQAALATAGLTEEDFAAHVRAQLDELSFIDVRLRPAVRFTEQEVQSYYREQYLPELRRRGAAEKPLTEVRPKIEQLVMEQRLNTVIGNWIDGLRSQASIEIHDKPGADAQPTRAEVGPPKP